MSRKRVTMIFKITPIIRELYAARWDGIPDFELKEWLIDYIRREEGTGRILWEIMNRDAVPLLTKHGYKTVHVGDWIIKDGDDLLVLTNNEFIRKYEIMSELTNGR